jgi:hypothetical protein
MEAIPLSETSAAACEKALTFTWISRFGVPETIASDRGPQFTSNLWFQLCEMLNISHKQTTAYHPESNSQGRAAAATWSEELSFVILGLRAQPREDTDLSPAEAVFGAQIVFPNEFLQNDELSVDTIVKKFAKTLHVSAPSLPRHNSSIELPSELFSAALVWVRRGGLVPPLQPLFDGPYAVLRCGPRSFTIRVGSQDEVVAVSRLKACTAANVTPGSARVAAADRRARAQVVLPQPSGSHSQTRWSLHLLRRRHKTVPNRFPTRRGGFCTPRTGGAITGATDAVPVPPTGTATEVGPLTSSPPSRGQRLGGALWTPAYTPTDRLTSWGVLYHPCTVPVYKLLFIRQ